jgi:hypothetical protein
MLHQNTQKEKTVQSCHLTIVVCNEGHLTPPCCSHVASFEISNFNSYGVLCRRGIIWGKKMVTTMSRSRIHMQPMRRLKHTSKRVHFFLLGRAGGGWGWRFLNSCVPIIFPTCSHMFQRMFLRFPWMFSKFAMCSPRVFPIAPHFISYPLPNSYPFLTYILSQMGGTPSSYRNCYCWGASQVSVFIGLWTNQNGLLQKKKKTKTKLGRQPI